MQNMKAVPARRPHVHKFFYEYNFTNFMPTFDYYFVSEQLHNVSFFVNLKENDNNFCLRKKCHSRKFREIILSFIRPKENSVFAIHDIKGVKLLTRRS